MISELLLFASLALARPLDARVTCPPPQAPEEDADKMLAKAEAEATKGDYAGAARTYKTITQRFPGTKAAAVAAKRAKPSAFLGWADALRNGPSANRADIVLMGDGYQLDDIDTFDEQMKTIVAVLEQERCLQEYFTYFNFVRAELVSADNGVDGFGRDYDTVLGAEIRGPHGDPSVDAARVKAVLAEIPENDGIALAFVKSGLVGGSAGTDYACIGGLEEKITRHEFGHAFAGLSDESDDHNDRFDEPRDGINIALTDDEKLVPWKHWIEAKVPGIGVFRGGGGKSQGVWKPSGGGCVMQGFDDEHTFCRVCCEGIVLRIYSLVDPIDAASPQVTGTGLVVEDQPIEFEVRTMQPRTHALDVRWWVIPRTTASVAQQSARERSQPPANVFGDRRDRGPLPPISEKPRAQGGSARNGVSKLKLLPSDFEPGLSLVVCRVRDDTRASWDRWPIVLSDPHGVLESERTWWVMK
jgi:hypothetical protein